jgi:hypothetical protein
MVTLFDRLVVRHYVILDVYVVVVLEILQYRVRILYVCKHDFTFSPCFSLTSEILVGSRDDRTLAVIVSLS